MPDTEEPIRCRATVDPHVHCELFTHLSELNKRKSGDRIVQLAVIGLSFLNHPKNMALDMSVPTEKSNLKSGTATGEKVAASANTGSNIDQVLGSQEEFAKAIAAMEQS